ncbi:MAG: NADH-quinone oxidoreductase subunit L [Coriobacteriia bacterium]|nr:NADH-quinone oxidoreductase subunit L [Coriobacteriia bacterium]
MSILVQQPWIAVLVPATLAFVIALGGRRAVPLTRWLALVGPLTVLATGVAGLAGAGSDPAIVSVSWLAQGARSIAVGASVDALAAVMLTVVGVVSAMVVLFSVGYMAEDPAQARYFALVSVFSAAMTGLVISTTLVGLFAAWELVGACSYLLIGFWYRKPAAANAAMKAFIVTRIGDVGFLLGIALLWANAGTADIATVNTAVGTLPVAVATLAALMLFAGAAGKSAQFPLHIWLPEAMEGPTPVSALIHAATMVAAGVFLVARMWPVFAASEIALQVMLWVGLITALGAAMAAIAQRDIKRVLAYSTISQLGFMFVALGAGQWQIAIFHLVTHAAFKALLFLGSGSVIHSAGTQDLHEMGGLGRVMPVTMVTWVLGAGALAGIPPLAGFFSKDGIIHAAWVASPVAGAVLVLASLMTAFYITRATLLAFAGDFRGQGHPHESPWTMTLPLMVLAAGAVGLGFAGGSLAELLGGHGALEPVVAIVSALVALTGVAVGWSFYRRGPSADTVLETRLGAVYPTAANAFGVDALLTRLFVRPARSFAEKVYDAIDRRLIDGAVNGVGKLAVGAGRLAAGLQTGQIDLAAAMVGAGIVFLTALVIGWGGR